MSVDQVSGLAGGATGTGLGSVTGMLQGGVSNIINMGSNILDRLLPPEKREELKSKLAKFASEKPYLASFLLSQIALSGFPMFLFVVMTISVAIFALLAGLLVGLLGAVLFILAAVGFALVFLLPTLFFTTFAAVGVWLWGMGAYYIIKHFNKKDAPGVHVPMSDSLKDSTGLGDISSSLKASGTDQEGQARQRKTQNGTDQINGTHQDTTGYGQKAKKTQPAPKKITNGAGDVSKKIQTSNPVTSNESVSNATKSLGL